MSAIYPAAKCGSLQSMGVDQVLSKGSAHYMNPRTKYSPNQLWEKLVSNGLMVPILSYAYLVRYQL
jgi:hypothetical protein